MTLPGSYHFNEIIDIKSLQDIQDKFANIVGLSTITVNKNGIPVANSSKFSKFCNLVRSTELGRKRCEKCDASGGTNAMKTGKPIIYFCHSGLTDLAAPIIVDNNYIGCMLCGQIIVKEFYNKSYMNLEKLSNEIKVPKEQLEEALKEVKVWKYKDITEAADFLYLFSNFIAKIGVSNITYFKLLEQTKEKAYLEKLLKDTKIKALQSQINPHFLFNTLNTIARMALLENAPKTEELIYSLSDILRYSIKNSENMVSIETEINNVEKYLFIQHERYGNRIRYEINIDDKILHYKIPVMTLQPIIENSIIHGLECKKHGGKITILGNLIPENYVVLEIIDNGVGMDTDKLHIINFQENDSSSLELGIQNVRNRLKYYFGDNSSLYIKSKVNNGTKVTIKIPYIS
ncbi:sensor histidine kinase [Clostridium lundense]|uniref:sensor histidine kinase n=1 Tax=Clostridium lundense TaxID=319475 RepID=UPI0004892D00|nr:PocR ligand-binding domain-containing protein [Clostridium lundense]